MTIFGATRLLSCGCAGHNRWCLRWRRAAADSMWSGARWRTTHGLWSLRGRRGGLCSGPQPSGRWPGWSRRCSQRCTDRWPRRLNWCGSERECCGDDEQLVSLSLKHIKYFKCKNPHRVIIIAREYISDSGRQHRRLSLKQVAIGESGLTTTQSCGVSPKPIRRCHRAIGKTCTCSLKKKPFSHLISLNWTLVTVTAQS